MYLICCFSGGSDGKESACQCKRHRAQSLGQEDPLEKGMAIHSSILAWRIAWAEGPSRLQSKCRKELDTTEATFTNLLLKSNYHWSLQWVVIFLLAEDLDSMFMAVDWSEWWFLKVGMTADILNIRQKWSLLHQLTLPFINDFSVLCKIVWLYFTHSRTLKIGVSPLNTATVLSTKLI